MADSAVPRTKRCASCGGSYLLGFFRLEASCIGCEAIRKRSELIDDRLRRKAIATRSRHGAKLRGLGLLSDEGDLEKLYGWSTDRMVEDIQRVRQNGCPYCLQPVDTAEHGLGVITLDVLDADKPPHYSTNVQWCCASCNSEKQQIPAETWGARQSMWNLWRLNQIRLGIDPESFGSTRLNDGHLSSQLPLW
jgi:hypothetical protein